MAGQLSHFQNYAPHVDPDADHGYATKRYAGEYARLLAVLDRRLATRRYLAAGAYTVADMACFGWVLAYKNFGVDLGPFPHARRWYDALKVRPALRRGVSAGKDARGPVSSTIQRADADSLKRLFVQDAGTVGGGGGGGGDEKRGGGAGKSKL